jgi:benzodiazapine receptor
MQREANTARQYNTYKRPSWSPPSWLFGPVWTVLYILITISYGYVGYLFFFHALPFVIVVPFILNLIFNAAFTFIQFRLKNFALALVDILLVLATLLWALVAIHPYSTWVSYVNIPYVMWVSFATVLQATITFLNRKK